jgi:predicted nucleic acid-binding protein
MPWLLDTNVISEVRRPKPDQRVVSFISFRPFDQLYVSTVTLAEIRFGIELLQDPSHRSLLNAWVTNIVRPMFYDRILPITEDVVLRWRLLVESGRKIGRTFSQPDLFIAATALEYGLILATRNTKDFEDLGLNMINPRIEKA